MKANFISEWMLLFMLVLPAQVSIGLYVPGFMQTYATGDLLYAKVSSLTSIHTLIPLSYYNLPYCKPLGGVHKNPLNLGELLMGVQIMNSPYHFRANVNQSVYLCTTSPLSGDDVELLKKMIRDSYIANILLDTLPVRRYAKHVNPQQNGFPVGYDLSRIDEDSYYIFNHLKFQVFVHKYEGYYTAYEIVGFEVIPCSVKYDLGRSSNARMYSNNVGPLNCPLEHEKQQIIKEGERVSFTYEVEFMKSDLQWSSRWDPYLKMDSQGSWVHSFSIINSAVIALFLAGAVARIFLRIMRERPGYQTVDSSDKEAHPATLSNKTLTSKLDSNDVFEELKLKKLLCVMVGSGVQIMGTAIITIAFAALGFMSPASQGSLYIGIISFYLFLGFLGGFVGVYLWKTIKGTSEGWKSTSGYVASGFSGIVFAIHSVLNFILRHQNSTSAIPAFVYLEMIFLWLGTQVPLTLLGGYVGACFEQIKCPTCVGWVPKEAGARKFPGWLLALGAGILPFGTIYIELFYIFSSLFLGKYYHFYGFLLIVLLLLIITCAIVSVIVTYMSLRAETSGWWWKAFWASGSVAVYVFLYCISYLIRNPQGLSGPHSVTIYLGYSTILVISTMLAAGSVGFLGSFYSVNLLS